MAAAAGEIRRREARLAEDAFERRLRVALFRRQRQPLPRQRQPIARDQLAFVHERRAAHGRTAADDPAEDALARFLARQPFRQRRGAVMLPRRRPGPCRARRPRPARSPGCRQSSRSVSRDDSSAASACSSGCRLAHSPAELHNREPDTATLLHERDSRIAAAGVERSKAQRHRQRCGWACGRVRIQDASAANRERRRVASQDETIAAGQHRRRPRAAGAHTPTGRESLQRSRQLAAVDASATRPRSSVGPVMKPHARAVAQRLRVAAAARSTASKRRVEVERAAARQRVAAAARRRRPRRRD